MLLNDFLSHLHEYSKGLYFLIGGDDKKAALIITAEGDIEYFDDVEKLVSQAPSFLDWDIVAFALVRVLTNQFSILLIS